MPSAFMLCWWGNCLHRATTKCVLCGKHVCDEHTTFGMCPHCTKNNVADLVEDVED
jgi:hypothetical protein